MYTYRSMQIRTKINITYLQVLLAILASTLMRQPVDVMNYKTILKQRFDDYTKK